MHSWYLCIYIYSFFNTCKIHASHSGHPLTFNDIRFRVISGNPWLHSHSEALESFHKPIQLFNTSWFCWFYADWSLAHYWMSLARSPGRWILIIVTVSSEWKRIIVTVSSEWKRIIVTVSSEWKRICEGFFYRLFISLLPFEIVWCQEGRVMFPLSGLTPPHVLCLSQARTWISNVICRVFFMFNGESWLFCWYWWNCSPSL